MRRMKDIYIELMEKLMDEGLSYEDAGEVAYHQLAEEAAKFVPVDEEKYNG